MEKLNKEETYSLIKNIFDYIDGDNTYSEEDETILGHPCLYFFENKEDLYDRINAFVNSKSQFDKYDIYYFVNSCIKFLLKSFDSHTKLYMKSPWFPIQFKYFQDKIYIVNITNCFSYAMYGELLAINGIDVKIIEEYFESIICYSTIEHFKVLITQSINAIEILRSLPPINNYTDSITYNPKLLL